MEYSGMGIQTFENVFEEIILEWTEVDSVFFLSRFYAGLQMFRQ
jgi:hypothetical protein